MSLEFRIALIGQAAFGESALNALLDAGEQVAAVFCPPTKEGRPEDPLKTAADKRGVPTFQFKRMRSPEAIAAFAALGTDLGVMAFVTDIVPQEILQAPRLGTIQYHPSLLPLHRGPSSINWPIIQGKTKSGLSIFWPDAGLDTGPILMQKEVEIGQDDTLGVVYFDKLFPLGIQALVESVRLVKSGRAPRIAQDESMATYEGWCKAGDCVVDWSSPATEVHNLVRGADPSPGASSFFRGVSIQLFNSTRGTGDGNVPPGTIVSLDGGLRVACADGTVLLGRVRPADASKKVTATEWAERVGVKPGDRFGVA